MKTLKFLILLFLFLTSKVLAEEPAWELVSMNPPRGNASYFANGANGNIYIAGYHGGIFYSPNYGESWTRIADNNKHGITCINNSIFTKGDETAESKQKFCVYKSTDNGNNWININGNWDDSSPYSNLVKDSIKLFITIQDSNHNYLVYCSTDEGNSWQNIFKFNYNGSSSLRDLYSNHNILICIESLMKNMGDSLFVSIDTGKTWKASYFKNFVYKLIITDNNDIFVSTDTGIWSSKDYGNTWEQKWLSDNRINTFFISDDAKSIYANVMSSPDETFGLKYSSDGGVNWEYIGGFENLNNLQRAITNINFKDNYLFATPQYLGVYRSEDNGKTWQEKNIGYSDIPPSDFVFADSSIYMSSWGIFKSTNQGKSFDYLGLQANNLSTIGVNSKGDVFVGDGGSGNTQKGIFRSTDGGKIWENKQSFFTVLGIVINSKDMLFIAPGYGSKDNGETWSDLGIEADYIGINDEDHIFGFTSGIIYRSTDDGLTWEMKAKTQIDPTHTEWGCKIIFNNKTKTAAYYGLITTDNGRTWFQQDSMGYRFGQTESRHFTVDSTYNWIYAGDNYIVRSTDNGKIWKRMDTTGLKTKEFQTIGCSPDGHIYVFGSTGGLYRSRDRFVSVKENKNINEEIICNPNPVHDFLEIAKPSEGSSNAVRIFNVFGEIVKNPTPILPEGEGVRIDVSGLPSGVYFVRVGEKVGKFVKI